MFLCCCTEKPDNDLETLRKDEKSGAGVSANGDFLEDPNNDPFDDKKGGKVSVEKNREREKQKLREIIARFTSEAVRGHRVQVFCEDGVTLEAIFKISKDISEFSVQLQSSKAKKVPFRDLTGIFKGAEMQTRLLASNRAVVREDLVPYALHLETNQGDVTLLLDTHKIRDTFYICLKVLRMSTESDNVPNYNHN